MAQSDLDPVAAELYRLAPEEFTAARDARAAELKAAGRVALATQVRGLRKPTQGAWVVNLLARERPDELAQLLDLGTSLRVAQAALQGDELRRLSAQRAQVVAALAREATGLARSAGRSLGAAVQREVEQTLEAALADPDAAEAVRAGRLSSALSYAGFGTPAEEGAVPKRATARRAGAEPSPRPKQRANDLSRYQEAAAKAAQEVEQSQAAVRAAEEAHQEWKQRVQEQTEALEHARREEASAALDVREALRRQKTALKAAQATERRLAQARERT
ncbi:MAG: hypothetical protein ACJ735_10610 [Actinomycetes bacterium]